MWTGGQSNSVGTNSQTSGYPTWPTTSRIQNFDWGKSSFRPAAVPLANEHNVGFSQTFANLLLLHLPGDDHGIVLVNTGVGGTGFVDHRWTVPDGDLLKHSVTVMRALAGQLVPSLGGDYTVDALLWHQGEDDAGDNRQGFQASYCHYLEDDMGALVDYVRAHFPGADQNTPFLDGGMLPYWEDTVNGTADVSQAIYALNTSRARTGTADSRIFPDFLPGTRTPNGEPQYRSGVSGDVIHFNATQAVLMGREYWAAYLRALRVDRPVPSARTKACGVARDAQR